MADGTNAGIHEVFETVLFKDVFEITDTMMILVDESNGMILEANPSAQNFFGYSLQEFRSKSVFDSNLISREELENNYEEMKKTNHIIFSSPHRIFNGEIRTLESMVSPMTIGGHKVLLSIIHDVTKRKMAEEALQERERRFRELANDLPLGIYECNLEGYISFVNSMCKLWFGYTDDDVSDRVVNILKTVIPEDRQKAIDNTRAIMNGIETPPNEYRAIRKDGSIFTVLLQSRPMYENGQAVGMRGVIVNITERKNMENALQRAEKLDSLGVLAGGIAHDFNNLLTGIFGFMDLACQHPDSTEEIRDILKGAMEPFSRTRALTQQLLTFAKGGAPVKKIADLELLIKSAAQFALSGSNIKAVFDIQEELWACEVDTGQISQVIDNIVINARHAMPQGGNLEIIIRNVENTDELLPVGRYVRTDIVDHGVGIAPDVLPHIFDPFFTTRNQGSGLGLTTAYSIIKRHDGEILCSSKLSEGSVFTIYLPAVSAHKTSEAAITIAPLKSQNCKILILDDEPSVRLLCQMALGESGHTVQTASNSHEAIKFYQQAIDQKVPFDIVILDLTIPGSQRGEMVLQTLRQINPHIKAVASSGYSQDPVMADPEQFGFIGKLPKPYLLHDLEIVIQNVLNIPLSTK